MSELAPPPPDRPEPTPQAWTCPICGYGEYKNREDWQFRVFRHIGEYHPASARHVAVPARAHHEEKEHEMPDELARSGTTEIRDRQPAAAPDAGAPQEGVAHYPIRAHVEGCPKTLRVPVDLCDCGGRDFTPAAPVAHQERTEPTPHDFHPFSSWREALRHTQMERDRAVDALNELKGAPARAAEWQPLDMDNLPKGKVLLTNNINARDAFGGMSHVWLGLAIRAADPEHGIVTFADEWDIQARYLTHWCPVPLPPCALTGKDQK